MADTFDAIQDHKQPRPVKTRLRPFYVVFMRSIITPVRDYSAQDG